jgi:DNA-binding CsgD family transcriptional regulator
MITLRNTLVKIIDENQQLDNTQLDTYQDVCWVQEVLESFQDGILILSETGELVYANAYAYQTFRQLNQGTSNLNVLPTPIWKLCESLLARSLPRDKIIILSDEIVVDKSNIFWIRVRWLDLNQLNRPCLLITIENRYESLKGAVLAEATKYRLTHREVEVWCLYRAKYSYKEIASHLFISINTVKKHIKNIHLKQQAFIDTKE